MITVTQYEKDQWSRFAQAAYAADRNAIGHRYSGAASIPNGARLPVAVYDSLQAGWRAWFVFNDFSNAESAAPKGWAVAETSVEGR